MVFCTAVHDGLLKATLGPLLRLHVSNGHNVRLKKDYGFHSVHIVLSLIGEKPGVKRNHFQKIFGNFFMPSGLLAQFYYTVKMDQTEKIWR